MNLDKLKIGRNPPHEVNVVIEIPGGTPSVKYEIDKDSGALFVDRFIQVSMSYPAHYGFIPHTLSADGDPCDALVIVDASVVPGCVIKARPIGVIFMEDEAGEDEKIITVPIEKEHPYYTRIQSYKDFPEIVLRKITHFFENYKTLEVDKWVKIKGWGDVEDAKKIIMEAVDRAKNSVDNK
jgi:inorganic pyrophosphatase